MLIVKLLSFTEMSLLQPIVSELLNEGVATVSGVAALLVALVTYLNSGELANEVLTFNLANEEVVEMVHDFIIVGGGTAGKNKIS